MVESLYGPFFKSKPSRPERVSDRALGSRLSSVMSLILVEPRAVHDAMTVDRVSMNPFFSASTILLP